MVVRVGVGGPSEEGALLPKLERPRLCFIVGAAQGGSSVGPLVLRPCYSFRSGARLTLFLCDPPLPPRIHLSHRSREVSPPPAEIASEAADGGAAPVAPAPPAAGLAGAPASADAPPAAQLLGTLQLPPEGAMRMSGRLVADL